MTRIGKITTSPAKALPENSARRGGTPRDSHRREIGTLRAWFLSELINRYGYPKAWIDQRVTNANEQPDEGLILEARGSDGTPFMWFALAATKDMSRVESALRLVLMSQRFGALGLVTDGVDTRVVRRRFDTEKCDYVADIEPYTGTDRSDQTSLFPSTVYLNTKGSLAPLSTRVENVFFECHSHIRDIDGLHPDEALDEFCKILYAKLYDEAITKPGSPFRLQRWVYSSAEECAAAVRRLYQTASADEDVDASVGAGVFASPIRLSSSALTRVIETLQGYSLSLSATDIKGRAFQRVLGPATRAGMGQYFTPDPVIRCMVEMIAAHTDELVLDPFCGSAHFLSTVYRNPRPKRGRISEKALAEYAATKLFGIEKSDRMVRIARTDMRLQGDGHTHLICTDSLLPFHNYPTLRPESFDVVLTNPPFGSILSADAVAKLGHFALAEGRRSIPLEIVGLERAVQFLRPGGRLGIVLPESILSNPAAAYVRSWLANETKLRAVVSLPIETFSPYGANIKTSVLFVRKWRKGERESDYAVFLARAENVGYDASGRLRDGADLMDIAERFSQFIRAEGW